MIVFTDWNYVGQAASAALGVQRWARPCPQTAPRSSVPKLRIISVRCPCCEGKGAGGLFDFCLWCEGHGKVKPARALHYARQAASLAIGGYVSGDLDWNDRSKMLKKADAVCKFLGERTYYPHHAR